MDGFRVAYLFPTEEELAAAEDSRIAVGVLEQGGTSGVGYVLCSERARLPGSVNYRLLVNGELTHGMSCPEGTPWAYVLDWAHTEMFRDGRVAAGGERFPPFVRGT